MTADRRATRPFHAPRFDIGATSAGALLTLSPLEPGEASVLGKALAGINPWAAYGTPPERLTTFFATVEAEAVRFGVRTPAGLAGIVVVRHPWLHGPYLHFLAMLPGNEGQGIGHAVLLWLEAEARLEGARNCWLCVSAINTRARTFYERHGYRLAAALDDLAADGMAEQLMRKRL